MRCFKKSLLCPAGLFAAGLFLCLATGVHNIGIIAMDDYADGIAWMIPAGQHTFSADTYQSTHPPHHKLILMAASGLALRLGLTNPVAQLRFVLGLIALVCFSITVGSVYALFRESSGSTRQKSTLAMGLIAFYGLTPLFMSRPMSETLSMPFLAFSAYLATRYFRTGGGVALAAAVLVLSLGSLLRFQIGICIFALGLLVAHRRKRADWVIFLSTCLVGFLATGLIDHVVRGGFHRSLWKYLEYNATAGIRHGSTPFYVFILVAIGLSFPPAFFSRYRGFHCKAEYRELFPVVLYFFVFLIAHSLSPHKEERFFVPVLPLFLACLVPLLHYFIQTPGHRWRVIYFGVINVFILAVACWAIPQNNVIGLAADLSNAPQFTQLAVVETDMPIFPSAYVERPLKKRLIAADRFAQESFTTCDELILVRQDVLPRYEPLLRERAERWGYYPPYWPEALVIKLNPRQNIRRSAFHAFLPRKCGLTAKRSSSKQGS